jgi:hypothetical protein
MSRKLNHHHILFAAAAAVVTTMISAGPARAAFTFTFDEFGNGRAQTPSGSFATVPSLGNVTDPFDPTSGLKPLAYSLVSVIPSVVATDGDINIFELGGTTNLPSDLLRFNHGIVYVYSDKPEAGEPAGLADVGLPLTRQPVVINREEVGPENGINGLFGYAPVAGMPGFYPPPAGPATYNFVSDGAVPEPTSFAVTGAIAGCALLRRRRHRPASTTPSA